jgi:hypothetical protein
MNVNDVDVNVDERRGEAVRSYRQVHRLGTPEFGVMTQ